MNDDRGAPQHLAYGLRLTDGSVLPAFRSTLPAGSLCAASVSTRPPKISVVHLRC